MKQQDQSRQRVRLVPVIALLACFFGSGLAYAAPVTLSAEQAVAKALQHNLDLAVQRQSVALSKAPEQGANAAFEPALFADVSLSRSPGQISRQRAGLTPVGSTNVGGTVGVKKTFSTGTSVEASLSSGALMGSGSLDPAFQTSAALTARQSLLEGISKSANEIALTEARLQRKGAQQQLGRKAELVARDTLAAYFELHAALAQDAIQALAVTNAERTLKDTKTLIVGGRLAPAEEIASHYALQQQQRARLSTQRAIADARDKLARLMGLVGPTSLATPELVTVQTQAKLPAADALPELYKNALTRRGDLQAAQTAITLSQAKVAASKHKTLPKLDLVGSVFVTGLSGTSSDPTSSLNVPAGYFSSYKMDQVGWSVGLVLEVPLGNKAAQAALTSAEINLRRAQLEKSAAQQALAQELNAAWRAVKLAKDQLTLTTAAQQVAESKLAAEQARYDAGKTTAHILATVQAEVIKEQLGQAQAAADLNKALATLHASCGDLLERMKLGAA